MEAANSEFQKYQDSLLNSSQEDINIAYSNYQKARNAITGDIYAREYKKWSDLINSTDSKKFWDTIDWKGNLSKQMLDRPSAEQLSSYFENLYKLDDHTERLKISELESNVYIPLLDDPITENDINTATKSMKKGGYDFNLASLYIIVNVMSPILVIILNMLFYLSYPASLATSLLIAIYKKGNSLLEQNYRGIQILPAIGALYDRIICNRLNSWIGVSEEQTAFQKKKSTLQQLFIIRLLIEICKKTGTPLYIGYFDLEKAFDKVSGYSYFVN